MNLWNYCSTIQLYHNKFDICLYQGDKHKTMNKVLSK